MSSRQGHGYLREADSVSAATGSVLDSQRTTADEQLNSNLLFRWFVGCRSTTSVGSFYLFQDRERLLEAASSTKFFAMYANRLAEGITAR